MIKSNPEQTPNSSETQTKTWFGRNLPIFLLLLANLVKSKVQIEPIIEPKVKSIDDLPAEIREKVKEIDQKMSQIKQDLNYMFLKNKNGDLMLSEIELCGMGNKKGKVEELYHQTEEFLKLAKILPEFVKNENDIYYDIWEFMDSIKEIWDDKNKVIKNFIHIRNLVNGDIEGNITHSPGLSQIWEKTKEKLILESK